MTKKIVIFGGNGQVGLACVRALRGLGEVFAPSRNHLDLMDLPAVEKYLENAMPDLVVNAAAYTKVDAAETEFEIARTLNQLVPQCLAEFCDRHGKPLVHFSTDYVYSGKGLNPWVETDTPAPMNAYGRTKLAGDLIVQEVCSKHLILRTSWVISTTGPNFVRSIIQKACKRHPISVVCDQIGSPTSVELIAGAVRDGCLHGLQGLFHVTSTGYGSWADVADHILSHPSLIDYRQIVSRVSSPEYKTKAQRPLNSRLDCSKWDQLRLGKRQHWKPNVDMVVEGLMENFLRRNR